MNMSYYRFVNNIEIDIDYKLIRILLDLDSNVYNFDDLELFLKEIKPKDLDKSISLIAYALSSKKISIKVVTLLLEKGVNPNNNWLTYTALHAIDRTSIFHYLDIFVKYGANLNLVTEGGDTILSTAALYENIMLIKKLLSLGASTLVQNKYGENALLSFIYHIDDENHDNPNRYKRTKKQEKIIAILDLATRKEMEKFNIITQEQLSLQDWRDCYLIKGRKIN